MRSILFITFAIACLVGTSVAGPIRRSDGALDTVQDTAGKVTGDGVKETVEHITEGKVGSTVKKVTDEVHVSRRRASKRDGALSGTPVGDVASGITGGGQPDPAGQAASTGGDLFSDVTKNLPGADLTKNLPGADLTKNLPGADLASGLPVGTATDAVQGLTKGGIPVAGALPELPLGGDKETSEDPTPTPAPSGAPTSAPTPKGHAQARRQID